MKKLFDTTRRAALGTLAGAALLAAAPAAFAQAWPAKPVRIVIGAPAGGIADIVARLLAEGLQKEWGQPVIVEPKPRRGRHDRDAGLPGSAGRRATHCWCR